MNTLIRLVIAIYFIAITYLAYPTIKIALEKDEYQDLAGNVLDAGQSDEQWEFLQDVELLIYYARENGYKLTAGEIYRTMYQQRHNVAKGVSWTYNSNHLKRKAIDINLFIKGTYITSCKGYEPLGEYWESLSPNNRWGGRWNNKDCPHFERR